MLLGFEMFSYLLMDEPDLLIEWFDELIKHEINRVSRCADYELSPLACVFSDIAGKNGLLFSPQFLKTEYFPRLKCLIDEWHKHGIRVIYHSEGDITEVIPDLINAGADGINPLEPDILDIRQIRADYPDLILWGGIDNNELLCRGSVEQVEQAVKDLIDSAGSNGRLLLGSSGQIHPANKLENVLAMFQFGRKYGKY
jgi:uroporphyrinogen decarboxylase